MECTLNCYKLNRGRYHIVDDSLTAIAFQTWDNYKHNLGKQIRYLSYRVASRMKFVEYIEKQQTEGCLHFNDMNHSP